MSQEPRPGRERFEANGRIGVVGRGRTLAEAFAQTALAMFEVIASDLGRVQAREVREIRAHGAALDALLASWLTECLYVHDVEGFIACEVELVAVDETPKAGGEPYRLHGVLRGEELDPMRHSGGTAVIAVSPAGASVQAAGAGGFDGRAMLDTSGAAQASPK